MLAMNQFFTRHSFKVMFLSLLALPVLLMGAGRAMRSNDNNVQDWLPDEYQETQTFKWFRKFFENETFVLVSWDGCTLDDGRVELLARKLVPPAEARPADKPWFFAKVETGPRVLERLTTPPISLKEDTAIARMKGLFVGPDGKQTCAVVTLTPQGKANLKGTLDKIYEVGRELALPRERIRMGGPPVDNVAISEEGTRTLVRLIAPAGIIGVLLAYWCLRSVRLTTMVFGTALYAGALSLAIVWYSGYKMNAILLTMPAVVYVAAVSGAIHFANYYRDSVVEGGVAGAPARALKHASLACTLSAVTTAFGLLSLYTSELMPIKYFGVYTAIGVMVTLLLLFVFLPAWMQLWPMKLHSSLDGDAPKVEDLALPHRWREFLSRTLHRHRFVFTGLLLVMVACGFGLPRINTSIKLTKLFSDEAEIIHSYRWLEEKLGPLVPMEVVVCIDDAKCPLNTLERMRLVARVQESLTGNEAKGIPGVHDIGNTLSAVTFAPSLEVKRMGLIRKDTMANVLNEKLAKARDEYKKNDLLASEGDQEMWRISARVGALNDIDYGEFIHEIETRVEGQLKSERHAMVANAQKQAKQLAAAGKPAPAVPSADGDLGITAVYTGLVPVVYKAQRAMLEGLAWNFLTDLATVIAVVIVFFRELSAGLVLFVPSVFPVVVVFGLLGWLGVQIDVGTIMTPTVALGVSIDDAVHFLIAYRRGLAQGQSRRDSTMLAYELCARAMYQSWAVLGLGLAVFWLSSFMPTQRFGMMMVMLLTAALLGNLFFLGATLTSPLSYFVGRRIVRKAKAQAAKAAAQPVQHALAGPAVEPATTPGGHVHSGGSAAALAVAAGGNGANGSSVPHPHRRQDPPHRSSAPTK